MCRTGRIPECRFFHISREAANHSKQLTSHNPPLIGNFRDRVTALRLGRRQRDGAQAGPGTPGRGREGGLEIAQRGEDGLRDNDARNLLAVLVARGPD